MKYTLADKKNLFVKTDNDGKAILLIKSSGFQVFLNKMAVYILNIAKSYSDTDDLMGALCAKFPDVDKRLIQNDLEDLFCIMNVYGIVNFDLHETNNETVIIDDFVTIAGDTEYRILSDFILKKCLQNKDCYIQVSNETYYKPISLRYHTFNNSEYYFMVFRKGLLSLVIAINPPGLNSTVYNISGIFFPSDIDRATIDKLLKMGIDRICNEYAGRISKIRIALQNDEGDLLKSAISHLHFTKECTLLSENPNGSLSLYAFFI